MKKCLFLLFSIFILGSSALVASYDKLYIVGNATEADWDTGGAFEMTKVKDGVFTWEGVLLDNTKDKRRFKFLVARDWHPSITCRLNINSYLVVESGEEYDLYERPTGTEGYDNAFQVSSSGTYIVDVDLNTMKIICTKVSDEAGPDLGLFTKETLRTSGGEVLNYRKLTPVSVEEGVKYPLVIFLHGAGERGSDNSSQLKHGGSLFVEAENREAYPAYVLFPQCPANYFWPFNSQPASYDATTFPADYDLSAANKQVKELVDNYLLLDEIDKDRVYIVGLSMGAMGTFDLVCRFPEIFAAAVPICGGVNIERLDEHVKDVYWRIFHGGADGVVAVNNSRRANAKLLEIGADVEYIEFPGVDHDSWNNAFACEDFLPWLFSKTRKSASDTEIVDEDFSAYYDGYCLRVKTKGTGTLRIDLYSMSGMLLHTFENKSMTNEFVQYALPALDKGIYWAKIQEGKKQYGVKLRVKN